MTTELSQLLDRLERDHFYGAVEIKYEAGRVTLVRKTESIKLPDYRNNRGEGNERPQH